MHPLLNVNQGRKDDLARKVSACLPWMSLPVI
jgi:hypothetical protein